MNSEQNNELEEIDYNNPESIEKPKKKRVSKKIIPLTIAQTPDAKPLKEALVVSDFASQMAEYNKNNQPAPVVVKPKRVMSDKQKEALKLGRERKKLGLLPPSPPSKIAEVVAPVVVKPLPPVIVKPKTKSYRTMY